MVEFKKISEVGVINTLTDNDHVLVVDSDGALKQTASSNLGTDFAATEIIDTLTDNDNVLVIDSNGTLKQTASSNLGIDLTTTEIIEAPTEEDTLVIVSNNQVKRIPATGLGGYIFTLTHDNLTYVDYGYQCTENYDAIYDLLMSGHIVWIDVSAVYGTPKIELIITCALGTSGLTLGSNSYNILFPNGSHNLSLPK